jgi:hypothetical protein
VKLKVAVRDKKRGEFIDYSSAYEKKIAVEPLFKSSKNNSFFHQQKTQKLYLVLIVGLKKLKFMP